MITLFRSNPGRTTIGAIGLALAWTSLSFGAAIVPTAAEARTGGVFYTAQLAQPAAKSQAIAGGVAWSCEGTTCVAPKANSRALRVCRELNRELGQITAFTAENETLDAEALARCNG